jgi:hypothetical protein
MPSGAGKLTRASAKSTALQAAESLLNEGRGFSRAVEHYTVEGFNLAPEVRFHGQFSAGLS